MIYYAFQDEGKDPVQHIQKYAIVVYLWVCKRKSNHDLWMIKYKQWF